MSEQGKFSSIEAIAGHLAEHRYISDQSPATVIYLSYHLHKPIFLEGEPGVGKTEVALVLAEIFATQPADKIHPPRKRNQSRENTEKKYAIWRRADSAGF